MTTEAPQTAQILELTDAAIEKVLEIRAGEDDGDTLALRVEIIGASGIEYQYDLSFDAIDEAQEDDSIYVIGDLTIIVAGNSIENMTGATLDLPSNPQQGGLVIRNPNRPDPLGDMGDLELTGDIAEKVTMLLEERINPALASHGGFATLEGVDGDKVVVKMGGGCQGCSMSAITLAEGIKTAIVQAIPEVTEVLDATDHDAGENPFYQ